jgi:hypothetical protein
MNILGKAGKQGRVGRPFENDPSWQASWTTLSSGLIKYRKGERDGKYVIDYSSDGGINWELNLVVLELDEDSIIMDIDHGVIGYRHQIRGTAYKIDFALTPTGFTGIENTDWGNIYST